MCTFLPVCTTQPTNQTLFQISDLFVDKKVLNADGFILLRAFMSFPVRNTFSNYIICKQNTAQVTICKLHTSLNIVWAIKKFMNISLQYCGGSEFKEWDKLRHCLTKR